MKHDTHSRIRSLTTSEWMATEERSMSNRLEFAGCAMLFVAHISAAPVALKSLGKMLLG